MNSLLRKVTLACILSLPVWNAISQTGCNITQINTAMASAGFQPLSVSGYPCALYFYNPNTTNNWNTAQSQAAAVGASLLSVCSQAENDAVWQAALAAGVSGGLWIGFNDAASEGNWVWTDGSPCNFTNWNNGEPNNTTDPCSFTGEDAAIIQMSNGKWNDVYAASICGSQAYASIIKVNLCPQVTPTASASNVCVGSTVQLSASTVTGSAPYSYTWFDGSANQIGAGIPFSYTANANGTLSVTVTDQYGCTDSSPLTITTQACSFSSCDIPAINAAMAAANFSPLAVNPADFPCARYYYSNGTTNSWSTAQSWASNVGVTLLTVSSLAENNAVWQAGVAAGLTGGFWIGYNDDAVEGQWVWTDGTPFGFENWNAGEPNNSSCFPSNDGEDAAIIQMNNGKWNDVYDAPQGFCLNSATYRALIKVNLCPQTTPAVNNANVCLGASVQLTSSTLFGSTPYTYTWFDAGSNQLGTGSPFSYTPGATTTVTVVATDQFGCTDAEPISLTVSPPVTMASVDSASICSGSAVNIDLISNPTGATFSWIAAPNANINGESTTAQSTATLNNTLTNTGTALETVTYTVTPSLNGCTGTAQTVDVLVTPSPVMTNGNTASVCSGTPLNLNLISSPAGASLSWIASDNPAVQGESLTAQTGGTIDNTLINTSSGVQTVTYTVTPTLNGCTGTPQVITVTVNTAPIYSGPTTGSVCSGNPANFALGSIPAGATFNWVATDNTQVTGESVNPQNTTTISDLLGINGTNTETVIYTVVPSLGTCPGPPQNISINVNPNPQVSISGDNEICFGESAVLSADADVTGTSFQWLPGNENTAQITVSPASNTTYTVVGTTAAGCTSGNITFDLIVKPKPVASISGPTQACAGDTLTLTASSNINGSTFSWQPGGDPATQLIVSPTEDITYGLVAKADGCSSDTAYLSIEVDPLPSLSAPDSAIICPGEQITLNAVSDDPGAVFIWNAGEFTGSTYVLSPPESVEISVYAAGTICTSEVKIVVAEVLENCNCQVTVPNIFTPNGDGVNDEFSVQDPQKCAFTEYKLLIYNRWGNAVWKAENVSEVWNGKSLFGNAPDGTYYYVLTFSYKPGSNEPKQSVEKGILVISR
jgi:gliding motility-associated-like protein